MPETPDRMAVGFARVLRRAGLDVPTGAVVDFVAALTLVGIAQREPVRHAGRATMVRRPEDLALYDRAFHAWWEQAPAWRPTEAGAQPVVLALDDDVAGDGDDDPGDDAEGDVQAVRFSSVEVLRRRDLAGLDGAEWQEALRLLAGLRVSADLRRTRRLRATRRPTRRPDLRATLRASLRTGGEPVARPGRQRTWRPRRLVLLADVSGSMEPYARACLRFAQVAVTARRAGDVEVFAIGTRLTRLTRQLAGKDPDVALRRAAAEVADWSGGTRLGDGLALFNDRFGIRGMARGAVVVILSDGWDRGDPDRLGAEMARLHRVAARVVWVNPLKASAGYAPLARGMAAALPHVDEFVEGHSLAALDDLAAIVSGRSTRRTR